MPVITVNHLPGRTIHIDNLEYLFFSGTNYLGIGCNEQFRSNLIEAFLRYGTIYSSSRNNNLHLSIYAEAEAYFANKYGFEAALITTSGLLAGQLAIQALNNKKMVYAPAAHPAIKSQAGETLHAAFAATYAQFADGIADFIRKVNSPVVIASNTIDNIRCENYNVHWLQDLPNDQELTLLFDYSHGIGMVELAESIVAAQANHEVVVIASLAKAIGLPGGLILASKKIINSIRNSTMFIGASPMVPAYLSAFIDSTDLYASCLLKLNKNITYFNALNKYPFHSIANFPVYYTPDNIYEPLLEKNIFVSNFSYPDPADPPCTRIVLNAAHTEQDIEKLAAELNLAYHPRSTRQL